MPLKLTIKLDENGVPTLARAKEAIASIESKGSGDYTAVGPKTKSGYRAYGRYQVMGANIPQWTKEVFGKPMTPKEFLANPQAQDAVFEAKFGGYMQKHGRAGAAMAWFTGSPTGGGRDVLGTTAEQYVNKFKAALGGAAPAGGTPTTPMYESTGQTSNSNRRHDFAARRRLRLARRESVLRSCQHRLRRFLHRFQPRPQLGCQMGEGPIRQPAHGFLNSRHRRATLFA